MVFMSDTFADRIVGWRVSRSAKTDFVLDAFEQALHNRRPVQKGGLIHHSPSGHRSAMPCRAMDRGGQYPSSRYTERLIEVGIEPSAGSVRNSDDTARAKTVNRLYKTELVRPQGP